MSEIPYSSSPIGHIEIEKILPGDVRNPLVKEEVIEDFGGGIKVQVHSSFISVWKHFSHLLQSTQLSSFIINRKQKRLAR